MAARAGYPADMLKDGFVVCPCVRDVCPVGSVCAACPGARQIQASSQMDSFLPKGTRLSYRNL